MMPVVTRRSLYPLPARGPLASAVAFYSPKLQPKSEIQNPTMAFSVLGAMLLAMAVTKVDCRPSARSHNVNSFAGSNLYFLHALPQDEQKAYVETLAGWGAKVLRLWGESSLGIEIISCTDCWS